MVKVVAKSGTTATVAGTTLAAIDTIVRKHNEPENNLHVESANLQKPCWIPCNGITGFCAYCRANGRCCRIGYDIRGCNGKMGAPDEHVCVLPPTTDLEGAYQKVVKAEEEMRETGELDVHHKRFISILFDKERMRKAAVYQKAWDDYLDMKKAADAVPLTAHSKSKC